MILRTVVKAYSQDGKLVDEFEFNHPLAYKWSLKTFLALHFYLHPNGYVESSNDRTDDKFSLNPIKPNNLF